MEDLARFVAARESGNPPGAKELNELMSAWLLDHILKWDRKYAEFSRECAAKDSDRT